MRRAARSGRLVQPAKGTKLPKVSANCVPSSPLQTLTVPSWPLPGAVIRSFGAASRLSNWHRHSQGNAPRGPHDKVELVSDLAAAKIGYQVREVSEVPI
jgi:hypothetical protein